MGDWPAFQDKLKAEGLSDSFIASFKNSYDKLISGAATNIPERDITPASDLPALADLKGKFPGDVPPLLAATVVLKLNGGLGTGMGLDKAKSLLPVKGDDTFLDFIAKQVTHLRTEHKAKIRFMVMNSFSTSDDTLALFKAKAPEIAEEGIELMQNKAPKVDAETLKPAAWPKSPSDEWCPPGHGDLYAALANGALDKLLGEGYKYMFVSNSDNLGATLDVDLLQYFAGGEAPFIMEVCERTEADKKGGHLCVRDGQLLLRESAQCAKEDEAEFQNVAKHRYFNTNNLWVKLEALKELLSKNDGMVPLPLIKNSKTVDPRDATSTKVFQLETAMGAAIECFVGASAVVVPRERFAPVKTCNDLLSVRSDAYKVTADHRLVLDMATPPNVDMDSKQYKMVDQFDSHFKAGVPSLKECTSFKVKGDVEFEAGVVIKGSFSVEAADGTKTVKAGVYENASLTL